MIKTNNVSLPFLSIQVPMFKYLVLSDYFKENSFTWISDLQIFGGFCLINDLKTKSLVIVEKRFNSLIYLSIN